MSSIIVIKCGGSTMEQLPPSFFETLSDLQQQGKKIVIVHGGGPAINAVLEMQGIQARFVDGLRFTCEQTMNVVEMVLGGSINKLLVRRLLQASAKAWGMTGVDAALIKARQTERPLGLVGEIVEVQAKVLIQLVEQGFIPVVAPLGVSEDGKQVFNINADVAAGSIAAALHAEKLLMITDVPGILVPEADGSKVLTSKVTLDEVKEMIASGVIYGGMIPKVQSALDALHAGVSQVVICQGTNEDLVHAFQGGQVGTIIS